ncbi:hypothetical protein ACIBI8_34705 [Streptomyces sp. NPDC050529]|uniref:hypothetical protein n=1 Tax=Streptomyces sp. NPDC050529 TaxID=3365624 RepID=UPI0037A6368C
MDWTTIGTGVAAVAAVVAALISLALFLASRRQERRSVENDKRNLFLSLNEQLMQPDLQRGRDILRRRVNSKRDAEVLYRRKRDHWTVSQAVAMFDLLGLYVSREYVDRDLVVAEWGEMLALSCNGNGDYFIEARESKLKWKPYPHYAKLAGEVIAERGLQGLPEAVVERFA